KMQTLADISVSITTLATMQRSVPCEWSLILISRGPCSLFGVTTCYFLESLMLASLSVSFANVIICMVARFWILRFGSLSRAKVLAAFIICLLLPAV
ncbi:hypothetical protein PMAYCL1PPCAC_10691, partial [Pristionchus mayeri]